MRNQKVLKVMAMLLTVAMFVSLTACGSSNAESNVDSNTEETSEGDSDDGVAASTTVTDITILTGPSGGTMEIVGAAAIEVFKSVMPDVQFSSVPSTGSAVNVNLLASGEGDIAIITADTLAAAINGDDPFEEPVEGLMAMCALYPNPDKPE